MPPHPDEDRYWSLLQPTLKEQYPKFVDHLSSQTSSLLEEGQISMIEFEDKAIPSVKRLASSAALRRRLNQTHATGAVLRRVFVLEGLPRNHVTVLGASLRVPPTFFASHWAGIGSVTGNLLNQTPRYYERQNQFTLTFPRLHKAKIIQLKGDSDNPFYVMESSVRRHLSRLTVFGDFDGPLWSSEHLSFWSSSNGESWDAILLVDPPLGKFVKWIGSNSTREVDHSNSIPPFDHIRASLQQQGSWYPSFSSTTVLGPNSADWINAERSPGMESMFQDICQLYPLVKREETKDPQGCMDICRRIVLSACTARLRIVEAQILNEVYQLSVGGHPIGVTAENLFEKSWSRPWDPRDFGRLVRAKSALEWIDCELYRNNDALGIYSTPETDADWEAEAWRSLQKAVQNLKEQLAIISQAYTQAASNKQAQQVGYLTSLATLFIPISFVAAIFSMGGDFSAGARYFWVYWVIAVPLVAVGCCLLFTRLGSRILGNESGEQSLV